ncbi:PilZ domain-containing protein [Stutzerimonas urumqiensis]|uniref:PilZ domain-containing protein n=1 Tax=Stutzerimonas urumqiensis TaxID=638269 RepID=UPI003BAACFB2
MSNLDIDERREYYRIEDRVALEMTSAVAPPDTLLDGPGFTLLGELHALESEAQHLLRALGERNRTLATYLKVQNRRLDILSQALARHLLSGIGEQRDVILSEGGIRLTNAEPLPIGEAMTLSIVLGGTTGLQLAAKVVHCQAEGDGHEIGFEFMALTEAQRQLLARHIFQKQALMRRLAREPSEDRT